MQGSTKRESLEQTLRKRLVSEIRRLQDFNRDLRGESQACFETNAITEGLPQLIVRLMFKFSNKFQKTWKMPGRMLRKKWKPPTITSTSWRSCLSKVCRFCYLPHSTPWLCVTSSFVISVLDWIESWGPLCSQGYPACRNFTCITSAYLVRRLYNGEFSACSKWKQMSSKSQRGIAEGKKRGPPPPIMCDLCCLLRNWTQAECWCLYGLDEECSMLCGSEGWGSPLPFHLLPLCILGVLF